MPYWETPERAACPDEQEPQPMRCPHCGEPCDTVFTYYGPLAGVAGCPSCLKKVDAYEYFQDTDGEEFL